jgi:hypothetical protein
LGNSSVYGTGGSVIANLPKSPENIWPFIFNFPFINAQALPYTGLLPFPVKNMLPLHILFLKLSRSL